MNDTSHNVWPICSMDDMTVWPTHPRAVMEVWPSRLESWQLHDIHLIAICPPLLEITQVPVKFWRHKTKCLTPQWKSDCCWRQKFKRTGQPGIAIRCIVEGCVVSLEVGCLIGNLTRSSYFCSFIKIFIRNGIWSCKVCVKSLESNLSYRLCLV